MLYMSSQTARARVWIYGDNLKAIERIKDEVSAKTGIAIPRDQIVSILLTEAISARAKSRRPVVRMITAKKHQNGKARRRG